MYNKRVKAKLVKALREDIEFTQNMYRALEAKGDKDATHWKAMLQKNVEQLKNLGEKI